MKYLTIIRHAKSSWDDISLPDIVRPLNERGKASIPLIANYLADKNISPSLIITSPATRALHTAIAMGAPFNLEAEDLLIRAEIYFGSVASVADIVRHISDKHRQVFLIGHEPLLSSLIYSFTGKMPEKFPTCAACQIAFDINAWKNTVKGNIQFLITPKEL
jgi:phosphohistidine phosphatase